MKKIISILVLGVLILSGFVVIAVQVKVSEKIIKMHEHILISEPIINKRADNYITINFEEAESYYMESDKPILPIITEVFTFPLGTKIVNIKVDNELKKYSLHNKIKPSSEPSVLSRKFYQISPELIPDKSVYSSMELYPKKHIIISKGAGLDNIEHVLFLKIQVIPQYSPIDNTLYAPEELEIEIDYILPEVDLVINDEYDMVIITPNLFSSSIQSLINHKNSFGVRTFLKTIEEIYNEFEGRDDAEKIKYFIKESIENYGIKYILLVGDVTKVPIRECAVTWESMGDVIVHNVISDLYYADIYDANVSFSSWDSNNNDIFGEYNWITKYVNDNYTSLKNYIDNVDLYPDIGVGRLPCKNEREVIITIDKIITYESQTYGQEWFNRLLLMGGDSFPNRGDTYEGERINEYVIQAMVEFKPIKLWTSIGNFRPLFINREITKGAGFVCYSGHGFEYGFGTYPPDDNDMIMYYTPYLFGLFNNDKLPIVFLDACSTAYLDYKVLDIIKAPCFAWSITKKQFGGAIATIGATRLIYGSYDPGSVGFLRLDVKFFEAYEPSVDISQMLISAQNEYLNYVWKDCLTIEEAILLGDPSLRVGGYKK